MDAAKLDDDDEANYVDFSAAGLYLAAVQMVASTVLVSLLSVVCAWVTGDQSSAIRNLAVCTAATAACLWKPLRVGRVPGLAAVFAALRPCAIMYLGSLVVGQLVHSCLALQVELETPFWRLVVFYGMQTPLVACGLWRAANPVSTRDRTVVLVSATLLLLALLPLPGAKGDGPLCASPSLGAAALRVLRALLFAVLYSFHVFSSAPSAFERGEIALSSTRAAAASIWVLGVHVYALPLVLLQLVVLVYSRLSISRDALRAIEDLERASAEAAAPAGSTHGGAPYATVSVHSDSEEPYEPLDTPASPNGFFAALPVGKLRDVAVRGAVRAAEADCASEASVAVTTRAEVAAALAAASAGAQSAAVSFARGGSAWRDLSRGDVDSGAAAPTMTAARMAKIANMIAS